MTSIGGKVSYLRVSSPCEVIGRKTELRILMLGAKNTGKTALIVRFLTKKFIGEYDSSFDSRHNRDMTVNSQDINVEILDPASDVSDDIIRERIAWADGYILVFSVTSKRSFQRITEYKEMIEEVKGTPYFPMVLIGNKIDLVHARKVRREDGRELSRRMACSYYESSASSFAQGYQTICDAINETCQAALCQINKRKAVRSRRASLSPRPLRNAIVKMFGRTRDDSDLRNVSDKEN